MGDTKLRAWWSHRQALDGRLMGKSAAEVLAETGWARSVGGVGPYLTVFARGGVTREQADRDAARLEIYELPAARRCTYVLPASDFALGLKAGEPFFGPDMKMAVKLGVGEKELDRLCDAVEKALEKGPKDPDEIRGATGRAWRSLGEEGKKKGLPTTLPLALARLQTEGRIHRVPLNGRLDQQRYRYALWNPNPLLGFTTTAEEVATELARRYFHWIGPATQAEFQWFSGYSGKAAKAAMEPLKLVRLGNDDPLLMLPEHRDAFESFRAPKQAQYVLVSSIDGVTLLRRDLASLLEETDAKRPVLRDPKSSGASLAADLPSHPIFDRGRIVGLWEFDTTTQTIAWLPFIPKNRDLEKAVRAMEEFVRDQLGDARSFSIDSPKSREGRIAALRKAAK